MADTKISALSAGTQPDGTGTTTIPAVQSGANVKLTDAQLKTFVKSTQTAGHPGYVATRWYNIHASQIIGNNQVTPVASTLYLVPFIPEKDVTIDQLGTRITTLATGNATFGIYNSDATARYPSSVRATAAQVSTGTVGTLSSALGASTTLTAGTLYFFASWFSASPTLVDGGTTASSYTGAMLGGTLSQATGNSGAGGGLSFRWTNGTYSSTLPDLTGVSTGYAESVSFDPLIVFRAA